VSEAPSGEVPDVEEIQGSVSSAWETFVEGLPRAGIALAVLVLAVLVGRALRPFVRRRLARYRSPSFARVFAKLTSSVITTLGVLLALTILFPSVKPVDVLAGAGVATIAIGIAFQSVLGNLLAGILLLFRQPFRGGDQVAIGDVSGTVEEINIRETVVRTYDGRRVLIPNDTVYSEVITVQTAHPQVRVAVDVGIAYEADLDRALALAAEAAAAVPGTSVDPAPQVLVTALGASTVELQVLVWCQADQGQVLRTTDATLRAVKAAFDEGGVEMPAAIIALQATTSYATALQGGQVTPGGAAAAARGPG
jgi:small-conductance mechanosensitive channel